MFERIRVYLAKAFGIDAGNRRGSPPGEPAAAPGMRQGAHPAASPAHEPRRLPPMPKWHPTIAVDIERTAKTFAYYIDAKHSFAVLMNGTCVVMPEGTTDFQSAAEKIVHAILYAHPDVKSRLMNDGNWLVSYSQPAATVVFSDVLEANWAYIETNHLDGLPEGEVLLNASKEANQFDRSAKIALFGRAYMFMDAILPKVVKVWPPIEA